MTAAPSAGNRAAQAHEQALEWLVTVWSGEASADELTRLHHWRQAHPDHESAWQKVQAMDRRLRGLQALPASAAAPLKHARTRSPARRQLLQLAGLGGVLGLAWTASRTQPGRAVLADVRTGTGEWRELALADGSRVLLDAGSALDIEYGPAERLLRLHAGAIRIRTAPDAAGRDRPLRVATQHGQVQALGTVFAVRVRSGDTQVAVLEGAVMLRPSASAGEPVHVASRQQAVFDARGVTGPHGLDEGELAWTRRQLVACLLYTSPSPRD